MASARREREQKLVEERSKHLERAKKLALEVPLAVDAVNAEEKSRKSGGGGSRKRRTAEFVGSGSSSGSGAEGGGEGVEGLLKKKKKKRKRESGGGGSSKRKAKVAEPTAEDGLTAKQRMRIKTKAIIESDSSSSSSDEEPRPAALPSLTAASSAASSPEKSGKRPRDDDSSSSSSSATSDESDSEPKARKVRLRIMKCKSFSWLHAFTLLLFLPAGAYTSQASAQSLANEGRAKASRGAFLLRFFRLLSFILRRRRRGGGDEEADTSEAESKSSAGFRHKLRG